MKKENIDILAKTGILRVRTLDKEKAKSMLNAAKINVEVAKTVQITEKSATLVFREIYESIRQLGDAKWWTLNYEPTNHEASIDILKEMDIKNNKN